MKTISAEDNGVDDFEDIEEQQQRGGWGARGSRMGRMPMEFDGENLDMFGDGPISLDHHRLSDTDFYNSFDDDFDDHDIN